MEKFPYFEHLGEEWLTHRQLGSWNSIYQVYSFYRLPLLQEVYKNYALL